MNTTATAFAQPPGRRRYGCSFRARHRLGRAPVDLRRLLIGTSATERAPRPRKRTCPAREPFAVPPHHGFGRSPEGNWV